MRKNNMSMDDHISLEIALKQMGKKIAHQYQISHRKLREEIDKGIEEWIARGGIKKGVADILDKKVRQSVSTMLSGYRGNDEIQDLLEDAVRESLKDYVFGLETNEYSRFIDENVEVVWNPSLPIDTSKMWQYFVLLDVSSGVLSLAYQQAPYGDRHERHGEVVHHPIEKVKQITLM